MTIEQQLDKRINSIIQMQGTYLDELEISKIDYLQLCAENSTAKEQFLRVDGNNIYFRNVRLKIKE